MKYCNYRRGIVIDISNDSNDKYKFITIATDINDVYTYTKLVYSEQTIILNCEYNEITIDDLKVGDFIFVYHSNAMTLSIPPQTTVYIIEVK